MPQDLVPEVLNSSHTVSASIVVPDAGAEGVICAQGGRFSGWSLYCKDGQLRTATTSGPRRRSRCARRRHCHRARTWSSTSSTTTAAAGEWGATAGSSVDGAAVAEGRLERTIAFLFTIGEGFDVGCDLYTTVTDDYRAGDNAFTGSIEWVRIDLEDGPRPNRDERLRVELAVQ